LRLIAFAAETMTTTTMSQETHLPSRELIESITRLTASKACTVAESPRSRRLYALTDGRLGHREDS
jgi:hypothetical protein